MSESEVHVSVNHAWDPPAIPGDYFTTSSLVKHLLGILLELAAPVHVADVLCGSSTGAIGCRCTVLRW